MFRLICLLLCCVSLLCNCAYTVEKKIGAIQQNFIEKKFVNSTTVLSKKSDISSQDNLNLLVSGSALFHDNNFLKSDLIFEEFNKRHINPVAFDFDKELSSLTLSPYIHNYKPYMMDILFVSYYQLWDAFALNTDNTARVIINKSYERQKNMSKEYKKLIEKNKQDLQQYQEIQNFITEQKNTYNWAAFTDIMNPALMYLSGLYFLTHNDFNNAVVYLTRASEMMPKNSFIKEDLSLAKQHKKPNNVTWVFIESGFSPKLTERKFSFFFPGIGNTTIAISEPILDTTNNFLPFEESQLLTDVDALFMTEYNEYRINEILRILISIISKSALQSSLYNSNNKNSTIFGLLSSIYSISSTNAEIRTWPTLPKNINIIRKNSTKSDFIDYIDQKELIFGNKESQTNNSLIYIRTLGKIVDRKLIKI